jgi:hypothetical protein
VLDAFTQPLCHHISEALLVSFDDQLSPKEVMPPPL